jgi:pimeloyl-ACP methyl ester carboxylesterase
MRTSDKPTIVLVHGAWADGTSWQHVIPLLDRDGYTAIAVQIAIESLADDVATTKRVIRGQPGPVVVAAHSYGGMVMTGAAGYLYLDRAKYHDVFCKDVPDAEASVMAAVQKPFNSTIFGATLDAAAWKSIPSWFLVSQDDRAINPDQERFYAKRMNAKTIEVKSSHVSLVSHPVEVTKLIEEAAEHAAAGAMSQA